MPALRALLLGGSPDAAIESLLDRMQGDRAFATRAGREDLLQAFALLPADDARVPAGVAALPHCSTSE